jgi:hypothetical protein
MESHIIYSASSHLKDMAKWSEWVYCGIGDDIKEDIINRAINDYFQDSILYFVSNRKESGEISKQNILERIKKELGQKELFIWDTKFIKVIEFNKIGVMRNGFIQPPVV